MEDNKFKRTTVTAALPYANGPVHIGHLAGVYVPADIYVRYLRLKGREVMFVGGSDEHGVPVTIRAKKEGAPQRETRLRNTRTYSISPCMPPVTAPAQPPSTAMLVAVIWRDSSEARNR